MTTFLLIVIAILAIVCLGLYLAMRDYKLDLSEVSKRNDNLWIGHQVRLETSRRRGQLLRDISQALYYGKDLRDNDILDFYERVWENIQEDIRKELKTRA